MALTTATITEKLSRAFPGQQAVLIAETLVELHDEIVKIKDFSELKEIVQRLAQAQERTEQRVGGLEAAMERLAQAQERTEQRMGELAQAQKQTEQRVGGLEAAMERLAQAQAKTEVALQELATDQKNMRKELGGLAETVGYTLENVAYLHLPRLLEEQYGISVQGELTRTFVADNWGNDLEVNIYGQALQDGKPVTIIGESKSQLSANKVDEFFRKRVDRFSEVFPAIVPVLVTHMISSRDVEAYTRSRGCLLFYSYHLQERVR